MGKAPHPGKTPAQRRVLDEIGCGNYSPFMSPRTCRAMLDAGLIERLPDRIVGRDRFGTIKVREFQMPIPVHYQWCQAMSEAEAGQ